MRIKEHISIIVPASIIDNCSESSVSKVVGERSEIKQKLISRSFLEKDVVPASISINVVSRVFRRL